MQDSDNNYGLGIYPPKEYNVLLYSQATQD